MASRLAEIETRPVESAIESVEARFELFRRFFIFPCGSSCLFLPRILWAPVGLWRSRKAVSQRRSSPTGIFSPARRCVETSGDGIGVLFT
jgi:hypothetical protein